MRFEEFGHVLSFQHDEHRNQKCEQFYHDIRGAFYVYSETVVCVRQRPQKLESTPSQVVAHQRMLQKCSEIWQSFPPPNHKGGDEKHNGREY